MFALINTNKASPTENRFHPVIWSNQFVQGKPVLFGKIRENETIVHLEPKLTAYDEDNTGSGQFICSYLILRRNIYGQSSIPFEIVVTDKIIGAAEVRVKVGEKLNVNRRRYYKLEIVARDCGTPVRRSPKAFLLIKVLDINDDVRFVKETYVAYINEGKMYDAILTVQPTDLEFAKPNVSVCFFEIINDDMPFDISSTGVLTNKHPLHHANGSSYFFAVVGTDCDGRASKPIFIKVIIYAPAESSSLPAANIQSSVQVLGQTLGTHASEDSGSGSRMYFVPLVIACVSILLLLLLLAVVHIYSSRSRWTKLVEEKQDLEWDNSSLDS